MKEIVSSTQKPQVEEKNEAGINLESLIKLGIVEKTYSIIPGKLDVTLRTISAEEREEALGLVSLNNISTEDLLKTQVLKRTILKYAISKINTQKYETKEEKTQLEEILKKLQFIVVDKLWESYLDLSQEQENLLNTDLKKK